MSRKRERSSEASEHFEEAPVNLSCVGADCTEPRKQARIDAQHRHPGVSSGRAELPALSTDLLSCILALITPSLRPPLRLVNKEWKSAVDSLVTALTATNPCPGAGDFRHLHTYPALTALDLARVRCFPRAGWTEDLTSKLTSLTSLRFTGEVLDSAFVPNSSFVTPYRLLQTLRPLGSTLTSLIISTKPTSRTVELSGPSFHGGLETLGSGFTSLTHLDVSGMIVSTSIKYLSRSLPSLKSLSLSRTYVDTMHLHALFPPEDSPEPKTLSEGLTALDLSFCRALVATTHPLLSPLSRCRRLTSLSLAGNDGIFDSDLAALRPLTALTHLDLSSCSFSWEGMGHLTALTQLASLSLARSPQAVEGGAGLAALQALRASLTRLSLADTGLAAGVVALAPFAGLADLNLAYNRGILSEYLLVLSECLAGLTALDLTCCRSVTDECLEHLVAHSPKIASLNLTCCRKVTDHGVSHLARLGGLTALDLSYCRLVTNCGVEQLRPRLQTGQLRSLRLVCCDNSVEGRDYLTDE